MNDTLSSEDIGGIAFVMKNPGLYLPYTTMYCVGIVVGLSGNILIMGSIICSKELHTVTNMLIFNLSMADILISGFVDIFSVIGILLGRKWFSDKTQFCEFIAAVCLVACATSMINIGFLAFNRYLHIIYHYRYKKIFTTRNTVIFCSITWFLGFLVDLPNIVGWGGHAYSNNTLTCLWNRHKSHSYTIFFPMTTIVIPCCLIAYWYTRIFLHAYSSKRKIASKGDKSSSSMSKSLHIAKGLFGSYFLFTISWLPYGVYVMSDWAHSHPVAGELYTILIAHLNSALNPIFYGYTNPAFRNGYKNFIRTILRLKKDQSKIMASSKFQKNQTAITYDEQKTEKF